MPFELVARVLDSRDHVIVGHPSAGESGQVVELTPTEYKLCRYLMVNARRVLSKQQILEHVWDYDYTGDTGLVETYISYLRKKLEHQGSPPLIQTMRGFGYTIRPGSG